jgi:ATP-dependent helicase HrpA
MNSLDRAAVMRRDYFKLKKAKASSGDRRVERSALLRRSRQDTIDGLKLDVPTELPIAESAEEIVRLIRDHTVVIVAGETGSGKTTQLPKLCLAAGLGAGATIGHTQPRRIAARTVAQRIAQETGTELGAAVGFAVRFSDRTDERTVVKVMTDGLLLNEIKSDRFLDGYDAIIVDEAHERSLNIDFLLGYLKRLTAKRRDLKVIITSATIDVHRIAEYFDDAPIVSVGGRTYPVDVRYQEEPEETLPAVVEVLEEIGQKPLGSARDVLAFFSGEREIFETAKALRKHFGNRYEVLPLYARLSFAEQQKVFATTGKVRRVVLATNVAETSLTVPNIGYVIDPGFARINRYSYRSKLERLPIEPISRASADQRKGRCGRVAPGTCYRLYTETDYLARHEYTDPEIRRVNLASVVLQMHAFGLGEIGKFPFIDPPDPRAIKDALRLLDELQAIRSNRLTPIGKQMARIPIDPRLGRMIVDANEHACLREVLIIVSGLAVQDPRERPIEKAQAADAAHEEFADDKSDFSSFVKLWTWIESERQALTRNRWQALLRKRFINVQRVREWREIHRQLKLVTRELGFRENSAEADYRTIHESILVGSLSLLALHDERGQYTGARNLKLRIFPGSGLAKRTPKWIAAAEIVETSRVYARCVAAIDAQWVERKAQHLVKRQYSEPHWSLKRGEVIAYESVTLYGLRLVERRAVAYQAIDAALCRDIFLRDGLVHGAVADQPSFLKANLAEVAHVHDLEAKGRRRDLLVTDDDIYAFYAARIPAEVCRVTDLHAWLRSRPPSEEAGLYLTQADLNKRGDVSFAEEDFPGQIVVNDVELPMKYRFAPGEADDGASVTVPLGVLHAIGTEPLEWAVPGLLSGVVEHWLRALPKAKRRDLAPIADKVDELTSRLTRPDQYRKGRFLTALARLLSDLYRLKTSTEDWDRSRLPDHLLINVKVIDEQGKLVSQGRDLAVLKERLSAHDERAGAAPIASLEGLRAFPARSVPRQELVRDGSSTRMTYPGFVDQGDSVDLKAFSDMHERDASNRAGYARLALLELGKMAQYFNKELKKERDLGLYFASLGSREQLHDEILRNVVWYCCFDGRELPRDRESFEERVRAGRGDIADVFASTVRAFTAAMALRFAIIRTADELKSPAYSESIGDVRRILDWLVPGNLLSSTPFGYLTHLPRYLEGLKLRVENLPGHVPKDRALIEELAPLEERLRRLESAELYDEVRFTELKFYIEELRLRLFSEGKLKGKVTQGPFPNRKISTKKVDQALCEEEMRLGLA